MGSCWSEPPVAPAVVSPLKRCAFCGVWVKGNEYCEPCLQKNAMPYMAPSAPQLYQTPQYTYAVPYPQQQMYAYQAPPPHYQQPHYQQPQPQQQQYMSTGAAVLGGFMLGAVVEDILDPMD